MHLQQSSSSRRLFIFICTHLCVRIANCKHASGSERGYRFPILLLLRSFPDSGHEVKAICLTSCPFLFSLHCLFLPSASLFSYFVPSSTFSHDFHELAVVIVIGSEANVVPAFLLWCFVYFYSHTQAESNTRKERSSNCMTSPAKELLR